MNKFQLLRFLNKEHGKVFRYLFASIGFCGTLAVSQSLVLARDSFEKFRANQFKIATRRAGWLLRTFWGIELVDDEIYNFTEDLGVDGLLVLEAKLKRRRDKNPNDLKILSDQIYVWAALMEAEPRFYTQYKGHFEANATQICQHQSTRVHQSLSPATTSSKVADFDLDKARAALKDFADLFPLGEWDWYVVSGTFLGLIRENGFLPHDYDIDLGVHAEGFDLDRFIALIEQSDHFIARKIYCQRQFQVQDGQFQHVSEIPVIVKLIHRTHINVDMFIHYLDDDQRWHGSSYHRWNNKEFALKRYNLEGVEVNGPVDSDLYLTENYGNWRVKVSNFNSSTGTPNLTLVKNPSSIALLFRRMALMVNVERNLDILKQAELIDEDLNIDLTQVWENSNVRGDNLPQRLSVCSGVKKQHIGE